MMNITEYLIESILREEDRESLQSKLKSLIEEDLSVNIDVLSFSEDKDSESASMFFLIKKESANLYMELDHSSNTTDLFLKFDQRSKSELGDTSANQQVLHPRPIPITGSENIPSLIMKARKLAETSIHSMLIEYFK